MEKRKSISKKTRFEVFKRDFFTCQYCNSKPPKVPLEIDHIVPVSKGGKHHIDNFITACFDCNRGKSNIELDQIPESLQSKIELKKIAQKQYKDYQKILQAEIRIINENIDSIDGIYNSFYPEYCFSETFRISVKKFINKLGVEKVIESMETSCIRGLRSNDVLKYFCGVCWAKIKNNE